MSAQLGSMFDPRSKLPSAPDRASVSSDLVSVLAILSASALTYAIATGL